MSGSVSNQAVRPLSPRTTGVVADFMGQSHPRDVVALAVAAARVFRGVMPAILEAAGQMPSSTSAPHSQQLQVSSGLNAAAVPFVSSGSRVNAAVAPEGLNPITGQRGGQEGSTLNPEAKPFVPRTMK